MSVSSSKISMFLSQQNDRVGTHVAHLQQHTATAGFHTGLTGKHMEDMAC